MSATVTFSGYGVLTQQIVNNGLGSATTVIIVGYSSIGNNALNGCSNLTSITISNSVTSVGRYAFSGCSKLTSITIPSSVTSIRDGAFAGCSSLISITIPSSVTSIGIYAFLSCSSLTSITIPESITSISASVFENCSGLTIITIPDSVTSIGDNAFKACSSLPSITIPDSVTSIGNNALLNCSDLVSVIINKQNNIRNLGNNVFDPTNNSKTVLFYETIDYNALSNIGKTIAGYFSFNPLLNQTNTIIYNPNPPPIPPTIVFPSINATYGDAPISIIYTSNSNGVVTYTSSRPSVASVSGNTLSFNGVGNAIITATQAETLIYYAATTTTNCTVLQNNVTVNLSNNNFQNFLETSTAANGVINSNIFVEDSMITNRQVDVSSANKMYDIIKIDTK